MDIRVGNNIERLLKMKGKRRLGVKGEIADAIQSIPWDKFPGADLKFIESQAIETEHGQWEEFSLLIEIKKVIENPQWLRHIFNVLDIIGQSLVSLNVDRMGIQQVECGLPNYYYVLIYIINNGREKENPEESFSYGGPESYYEQHEF